VRGKGNFPANYVPEDAYYTNETWNSKEENWELKEDEGSSSKWSDSSFLFLKRIIFKKKNLFCLILYSSFSMKMKTPRLTTMFGHSRILTSAPGKLNRLRGIGF
jgi:hypothetical protein